VKELHCHVFAATFQTMKWLGFLDIIKQPNICIFENAVKLVEWQTFED